MDPLHADSLLVHLTDHFARVSGDFLELVSGEFSCAWDVSLDQVLRHLSSSLRAMSAGIVPVVTGVREYRGFRGIATSGIHRPATPALWRSCYRRAARTRNFEENTFVPEAGMDSVMVAKPEMSPKKRALFEGAVVLVGVALLLWMQGGRPYSNWFYAIVALGLARNGHRVLTGNFPRSQPSNPPLGRRDALKEAVLQGVLAGTFFFAFLYTATGELRQVAITAIFFGPFMGVQHYEMRRGRKPSLKYILGLPAILLFLLTMFVLIAVKS